MVTIACPLIYSTKMAHKDIQWAMAYTKKKSCLEYINGEKIHKEIRNLIMMILLPKRLHFDGAHQAAFLRAAVSRVRKLIIILNLLFILDGKSYFLFLLVCMLLWQYYSYFLQGD